jgi:hypothetical protein
MSAEEEKLDTTVEAGENGDVSMQDTSKEENVLDPEKIVVVSISEVESLADRGSLVANF